MDSERIQLKTLASAAVAVLAVEVILRRLHFPGPAGGLPALAAARLVQIGLILYLVRLCGQNISVTGLGPGNLKDGLKTGLIWSAVFAVATVATAAILLMLDIDPRRLVVTGINPSARVIASYVAAGVIIGPAAEELFFRGILYGYFRRWGVIVAVVASTGLFLAAHLLAGFLPLVQTVGGLVFALAYERSKSLLAPYIIHLLGNGALYAVALMF